SRFAHGAQERAAPAAFRAPSPGFCRPADRLALLARALRRFARPLFAGLGHHSLPGRILWAVYRVSSPKPAAASRLRRCDRSIDKNFILLHARLRLVLFVDELKRAFAKQTAWQHHDADKSARPVGSSLREHRIGAGLVPRASRAVGCR